MRGRVVLAFAFVGVALLSALIAVAAPKGIEREPATPPTAKAPSVAAVQPGGHEQHDAGPAARGEERGAAVPPPSAPVRGAPARAAREEPRVAIEIVPEQQMRIGLQTATATTDEVRHAIRAVGSVVADERREAHIHTRVAGWIDDISVSAVGVPVKRGQVLYRLYAPEIVSTQQEIIAARSQGDLGRRLTEAAFERLALWDVAPFEIEQLRAGGTSKRALAFVSPISGFVVDKMAVKGLYVTPDMELYRVADLSRVWVIVSLYENEIPLVAVGDEATVALTTAPSSDVVRAALTYVYPELDVATRTGRARIELPNADGAFKPGMFANVSIEKELGQALVVPEDAIIFTGARNLVFKKTAPTRFVPVEVAVGPRTQKGRVILSGVAPGDEVVVRATFLLDAESRLKAALEKGGAAKGHGGHGG